MGLLVRVEPEEQIGNMYDDIINGIIQSRFK